MKKPLKVNMAAFFATQLMAQYQSPADSAHFLAVWPTMASVGVTSGSFRHGSKVICTVHSLPEYMCTPSSCFRKAGAQWRLLLDFSVFSVVIIFWNLLECTQHSFVSGLHSLMDTERHLPDFSSSQLTRHMHTQHPSSGHWLVCFLQRHKYEQFWVATAFQKMTLVRVALYKHTKVEKLVQAPYVWLNQQMHKYIWPLLENRPIWGQFKVAY
jgi:proteasome lid subunit RPN8/RPN11